MICSCEYLRFEHVVPRTDSCCGPGAGHPDVQQNVIAGEGKAASRFTWTDGTANGAVNTGAPPVCMPPRPTRWPREHPPRRAATPPTPPTRNESLNCDSSSRTPIPSDADGKTNWRHSTPNWNVHAASGPPG